MDGKPRIVSQEYLVSQQLAAAVVDLGAGWTIPITTANIVKQSKSGAEIGPC